MTNEASNSSESQPETATQSCLDGNAIDGFLLFAVHVLSSSVFIEDVKDDDKKMNDENRFALILVEHASHVRQMALENEHTSRVLHSRQYKWQRAETEWSCAYSSPLTILILNVSNTCRMKSSLFAAM